MLTPYEAAYVSRYNGQRLEGQRILGRTEAGAWVLSQSVRNLGRRVDESSAFEIDQNRLRVQAYDMAQSIFGFRREDHARFDWAQRVIRTSGRREVELPLEANELDPLSHQLALRCAMAQGLQEAEYPVVRRGKVKPYRFRRVGAEPLDTMLGNLDTVIVERVRETDERSTRIWLAPGLRYLMVQLEQIDREEDLEMTLRLNAVEFR